MNSSGQALEYARTIDPRLIFGASARMRRVNYRLDLSTAYIETGHYTDAAHALIEAERIAPEEVHCRATGSTV